MVFGPDYGGFRVFLPPVLEDIGEGFTAPILIDEGAGPVGSGGGFLVHNAAGEVVDGRVELLAGGKFVEPICGVDGVAPGPLVDHLLDGVVAVVPVRELLHPLGCVFIGLPGPVVDDGGDDAFLTLASIERECPLCAACGVLLCNFCRDLAEDHALELLIAVGQLGGPVHGLVGTFVHVAGH